MGTQNFYGDAVFKNDVAVSGALNVTGKVAAAAGVASGELATKGQVDAARSEAVLRANHTGTQPVSSIDGISTYVDGRVSTQIATLVGAAPATLDTLAEIAARIEDSDDDVANLLSRVSTAETDIIDLQNAVESLEVAAGGGTYKATIGDASSALFTLTHNLDTTDVSVEVFETTGDRQSVFPIITRPSSNTVVVDFDDTVIPVGSHRVIIKAS